MQRFQVIRDDNIYINSSIYNNTNQTIKAEYQTTFTSPLLTNTGDYYLSLIRFSIPNTIPIFQFQDDTYYVTLSYNGMDYTQAVQFVNYDVNNPASKSVYTFQQFIDYINTAFSDAFTALKTANPAAPPTEAPFLVFNHDTNLFSLYTEQLYDPVVAGGPTIEIFFNDDFISFFTIVLRL